MPLLVVEEGAVGDPGHRAYPRQCRHATTCWRRPTWQRRKLLFVAIPQAFEAGQIVQQARRANPDLPIVARAHFDAEVEHLLAMGASQVMMGEREIALAMLDFAKSRWHLALSARKERTATLGQSPEHKGYKRPMSLTIRILGLDPGLSAMGWGVIDGLGLAAGPCRPWRDRHQAGARAGRAADDAAPRAGRGDRRATAPPPSRWSRPLSPAIPRPR